MKPDIELANTVADLKRVRLVELDQFESTKTAISKRYSPTDERWMTFYDDGIIIRHRTDQLLNDGPVRILDRFPVTLADLIPEDCQAFQFSSKDTSITDTAVYDTTFNAWEVTGHDGCHATLESLALEFDIDLDTVIPLVLTAHPDYVEARR